MDSFAQTRNRALAWAAIVACLYLFCLAGCSPNATGNEGPSSAASEEPAASASSSAITNDASTESADGSTQPADTAPLGPSPSWVTSLPETADAHQIFVVAANGTTEAQISMHEQDADGNWQMIVSTTGYIGKQGIGKTSEGDALTPQGSFMFDRAFGIAPDPGCKMTYTQVTDDLYWSSDEREGMHYNQLVSIKDIPGLDTSRSEHLADYKPEYQYCLNVSFNSDCIPGNGSAIFLHCTGKNRFTAGCVAIPEDQMKTVMQHVEPRCAVVIDTAENLGVEA